MTFRVEGHLPQTTSWWILPVAILALTMAAAGCSGETADTTTTSTTAPEPTTTTTLPPDPAVDGPVYRVGLTSTFETANWWAALGTDVPEANRAILANTKASLFELTRPGFAHAAALSDTSQPAAVSQRGSTWVVEQPLRDDVFWSDGEQVTADDLVFYFDVVREFALPGAHESNFPAAVSDVEASEELTVRIEFGDDPSLTDWQTGVAMAPFVPSHFWAEHVDLARAAADSAREGVSDEEARSAVAAASLTDSDPDNDLEPQDVTADEIEAHRASVAAEAGREYLYAVESPREPSVGPLIFESRGDGVVSTRSNPDYFGRGTETTLYSDGSVRVARPGSDTVHGGQASGDVLGHRVVGPFISGVEWRQYESAQAAHEARDDGEVDFVADQDGLTFDQYNELAAGEEAGLSISKAEGFRFLAFNLRKPPMSDPVFRDAVATVVDKELVASSLFNGTLFPAYTVIHPDLALFHNPDVNRPGWVNGTAMSPGQRFESAITLLTDAGYTWDAEPELVYNDDGALTDVIAGSGLEMPNGVDVPELTIRAAPGYGEDPARATYALWIVQWMSDLGIPVTTEPTDLESIVDTAVNPATSEDVLSWDLDVLGWGGPDPALPGLTLVALFHSQNTVESGGLNTTGYSSPEFDEAADAFVAASTIDEAARWTMEMERIIAEDLPYLTLYRPAVIDARGPQVTFPVETIIGGHGTSTAWPESVRIDG